MKRLLIVLIALMLAAGAACAQESMLKYSREEVHSVVELLFAAAAGTTVELETTARKGMNDEQMRLRSEELAAYRAATIPWLKEVFRTQLPAELMREADEEELALRELAAHETALAVEESFSVMSDNEIGKTYLMLLQGYGAEDAAGCMRVMREIGRQWLDEIDHAMLYAQNGDYACWMYLPGTQIDYPVVQGSDNAYYMDRLFNGRRNSGGTLFVDYRNLPGFSDPNTLIYGHHMRNQSMFGLLDEYEEQIFYESHPYALFITEKGPAILEIFAAYTTDSTDHCYDIAISDEKDKDYFVSQAKRKSDIDAQVSIEPGDKLVTLSTCAYAFEGARYIVIGRLIKLHDQELTPGRWISLFSQDALLVEMDGFAGQNVN